MDDLLARWEAPESELYEGASTTPTFAEPDTTFPELPVDLVPPEPVPVPAPSPSIAASAAASLDPFLVTPSPRAVPPVSLKPPPVTPTPQVFPHFQPVTPMHAPAPNAHTPTSAPTPKAIPRRRAPLPPAPDGARRLRPRADAAVAHCWKAAATPGAFVRRIRKALGARRWRLDGAAQHAVLDALLARLCTGDLYSARLMQYLRHLVVSGAVHTRQVLALSLYHSQSASARTQQGVARLYAELLPSYCFVADGGERLALEAADVLDAFAAVLLCAARSAYFAESSAAPLAASNRFVALIRACGRRVPQRWTVVVQLAQAAPQRLYHKVQHGLGAASTPFEAVHTFATVAAQSSGAQPPPPIPPAAQGLTPAVRVVLHVVAALFGARTGNALQEVWAKSPKGSDLSAFVSVERAAQADARPDPPNSAPRHQLSLRDSVRAAEAIVRFLAERAAIGKNEDWTAIWGDRQRLARLMADTLPQLRSELRGERGCIAVAAAVVGCAAMVLGPALASPNGNTERYVSDLVSFAVGCMEDAAQAEETPAWRSFGLWLLLFATRCGEMLRAARCEHVKAARVLRAWGGVPTGSTASHGAAQQHSAQHAQQQQHAHARSHADGRAMATSSGSAAAVAAAEVVATFATPAAHAIIDMADANGDDDTMNALCSDWVQ